ncbi:hypothetical protein C8F04DRAFT_1177215 [Mycena alexandri]|uniref:Uncharacterized protein n=1 Tax=Mycena alexandri TaxID=1745969 RepID=A0AAD6X706_9AGAR|nr:hypothetical protein C8F04DRAFT_1177215 [Mycena alexandri]
MGLLASFGPTRIRARPRLLAVVGRVGRALLLAFGTLSRTGKHVHRTRMGRGRRADWAVCVHRAAGMGMGQTPMYVALAARGTHDARDGTQCGLSGAEAAATYTARMGRTETRGPTTLDADGTVRGADENAGSWRTRGRVLRGRDAGARGDVCYARGARAWGPRALTAWVLGRGGAGSGGLVGLRRAWACGARRAGGLEAWGNGRGRGRRTAQGRMRALGVVRVGFGARVPCAWGGGAWAVWVLCWGAVYAFHSTYALASTSAPDNTGSGGQQNGAPGASGPNGTAPHPEIPNSGAPTINANANANEGSPRPASRGDGAHGNGNGRPE